MSISAELANGGTELKAPQRLTLDDRVDWPGGWSPDSKTVFLYSDRNGNFDIYKQGVSERNAEPIVTGPEEKWAPQISPDGKWVLYMQWPKAAEGAAVAGTGKLMRSPLAGGPAEAVMEVKGHPGILCRQRPDEFRRRLSQLPLPVARQPVAFSPKEARIRLSSPPFDPVQGRKAELVKVPAIRTAPAGIFLPMEAGSCFPFLTTRRGMSKSFLSAGGTPQKLSRHAVDGTGCDCVGSRWQEPVSGQLLFARNRDCAHAPDRRTQTAVQATELGYFLAGAIARWPLPGVWTSHHSFQRLDDCILSPKIAENGHVARSITAGIVLRGIIRRCSSDLLSWRSWLPRCGRRLERGPSYCSGRASPTIGSGYGCQ